MAGRLMRPMLTGISVAMPAATAAMTAAWLAGGGPPMLAGAGAGAMLLGVASWLAAREDHSSLSQTRAIAADPRVLALHRERVQGELDRLEDRLELGRSVFEVSSELVGCSSEDDAHQRFTAAVRRWWTGSSTDLLVWERGAWRALGSSRLLPPADLHHGVTLPEDGGDLVLDLSAGVDGRACLVVRGAADQPALHGRSREDRIAIADILRGQLSLSLRRVLLHGELQALARIDPLTRTHRRWYGERRLQELVDAGQVVSVLMVDIDHFKLVNDGHGHPGGDRLLAAVGRALSAAVRTNDLVVRMGGEEFLAILPETLPDGAVVVAERMRKSVAALAPGRDDVPCTATVSIGIAGLHQDETVEHLLLAADEALYVAKETGRDRVQVSTNTAGGSRLRSTVRIARVRGPS